MKEKIFIIENCYSDNGYTITCPHCNKNFYMDETFGIDDLYNFCPYCSNKINKDDDMIYIEDNRNKTKWKFNDFFS